MLRYKSQILILAVFFLTSCNKEASSQKLYETDQFKKYWYAGKAEISSYTLDQARYGEQHSGHAVLIFVTEDFSKDKQVKLDNPSVSENEKVSVLKVNFVKKFVTGIYPYSMMLSTFTPVKRNQFPFTLKVSMSSQEWCGHVYTQLNLKNDSYAVESHSYFEKEGDESFSLKKDILEDELWNIIRLDPEHLPTGKFNLIPGLFFTRLAHKEFKTKEATAKKEAVDKEIKYTIHIASDDRTLSIRYQKDFPHKILGWKETFTDLNGELKTTTATLNKTLITEYWNENKNKSKILRDSLNIPIDHE